MNISVIMSLIATIAYIPLLIVLYANRPLQRDQKLFTMFLAGMMIWSFGTFLFRSEYFTPEKLWLAKITISLLCLSIAPLHYYLKTFFEPEKPKFQVVYLFTGLCVVFVLAFLPQSVKFEPDPIPIYGFGIIPVMLYNYGLLAVDVIRIGRKLRSVSDPERHNQMTYLIIGVSLAIIISSTAGIKIGQDYPIPIVGNCVLAIILTYTVIKHHLLDLRIVLRRGLTLLFMAMFGVLIYLLLLTIPQFIFKVDLDPVVLAIGIAIALVVLLIIFQIRNFASRQIDRLFYRESYEYRRELINFSKNRIKGLISLDQLGNEILTLLCGSVRCGQSFLMLPRQDTGDFYIRFAVPLKEDRPFFVMKNDSPILRWLQTNNTYLTYEKLEIDPEFRGVWKDERQSISELGIQLFFPILSRSKIVGILALGEKLNKSRYTLEDINLSERLVNDIATSLEKEYLQDQLKKREQELSLINRLAGVISSSLNIQEVYDAFVNELKEVVEVNYAAIALVEGNEIYFAAISTEVGSAWSTGQKIPIGNTATEWVVINKKPFYEPNLAKSKRFWTADEHARRGLKSVLYLPLVNKGSVIGVLILGSKKAQAYTPEQMMLMEHLAIQIAAPIENSRLYAKTEEVARVDGITGLFNRRHFDERLREEIDRHSRYGDMLSLILIDLDNFKKYNDTFGHQAGDRILVRAAMMVESGVRSSDLSFRYGGDEFAIILPHSSTMDAFSVAERIREKIAYEMSSKQLDLSVSIGVASWPGDGSTLDELCYAADMALYYSKRTGQNRTSIASRTLFSLNEPSVSANAEAEVLSTIYALAATLEARDKYTYGHSRRVSRYSVAVAEALNLPPEQVAIISAAVLLHDIGKVGIPDNILNKSEKLLDEEWELLKQHPKLSATIVGHIPSLSSCLAAVRHHHERWDGTGYPSGLKGENIPVEARILCVTDAFEAMISERPYRGALTFKQAILELEKCAGTQFDPAVVKAFIPIALSTGPDEVGMELQRSPQLPD